MEPIHHRNRARQPTLAADAQGNLHAAWVHTRDSVVDVNYRRWDAASGSWSAVYNVSGSAKTSADPDIVLSGGQPHLVWMEGGHVYYSRWDFGSSSWLAPASLAIDGHNLAIATTDNGRIHVVTTFGSDVRYIRWNGSTWSSQTDITSFPGVPASYEVSENAKVVGIGNDVYVFWSWQVKGSADFDDIFYRQWVASQGNWDAYGHYLPTYRDSEMPVVAVDGDDDLHVAYAGWVDNNCNQFDIFYTTTEGGAIGELTPLPATTPIPCPATPTTTPTPTATPTVAPTATPTATPVGTATPSATPSATPMGTVTPTATPAGTATATPGVACAWRDDFTSPTLDPTWAWVREDATHWSLVDRPGYLRLRTQGGELGGPWNDVRNILVRDAPSGDFTVETKLDFSPAQDYQQAGLLIYQDDDNYIKLTRVYADAQRVEFAAEIDQNYSGQVLGFSTTPVFLRIRKTGQGYRGGFSADGLDWTEFSAYDGVDFSNVRTGLMATNSLAGLPTIAADFDYVCVR